MTDPYWRQRSACQHHDARWWNPDDGADRAGTRVAIERAKAICRTECPVRRVCLEYALERDERHGVWGGHTVQERDSIAAARQK